MSPTLFLLLLATLCLFTTATQSPPSSYSPQIDPEIVYVDGKPIVLPEGDEPSLYKYMDIPDSSFSWKADLRPFKNDTKKQLLFYRMELNSLQWLTDAEVVPSQWTHQVVMVKPYFPLPGKAMLWIEACSNPDPVESQCYEQDLALIPDVVSSTGAIMFILYNIPNQPSVFARDPKEQERSEDRLVSFSWDMFMTTFRNRPDWIAYFPMAKASLRCMDAGEEYSRQFVQNGLLSKPITQWYIFGMSKRGAATWFLSAYLGARQPQRIFGAAPIVFDALNFKQVILESMPAKLGGFTNSLLPYESSLQLFLDDSKIDSLLRHIDLAMPWYRPGLSVVPKYIVSGALDEFFLLGNDRYWYDLVENKHRLIAPHADHPFILDSDWLYQGLAAHAIALSRGVPLPRIVERVDHGKGTISMCSDVKPNRHLLYSATPNPQKIPKIDYRMMKLPLEDNCLPPATLTSSKCISIADWKTKELPIKLMDGMWCAEHQETNIPTDTWISSFIVFSWESSSPQGAGLYTTPILILPDYAPFKGCLSDKANCPTENFM